MQCARPRPKLTSPRRSRACGTPASSCGNARAHAAAGRLRRPRAAAPLLGKLRAQQGHAMRFADHGPLYRPETAALLRASYDAASTRAAWRRSARSSRPRWAPRSPSSRPPPRRCPPSWRKGRRATPATSPSPRGRWPAVGDVARGPRSGDLRSHRLLARRPRGRPTHVRCCSSRRGSTRRFPAPSHPLTHLCGPRHLGGRRPAGLVIHVTVPTLADAPRRGDLAYRHTSVPMESPASARARHRHSSHW